MFRKNSIFIKVFIPVIMVMLLQTSVISAALFMSGTIDSLGNSAIETLRRNAENRSTSLERMMVSYWSNLDKLVMEAEIEISDYLYENDVSINDVLSDYHHETNILYKISRSLISALRINASTGIFFYFVDDASYTRTSYTSNGLYYRDFDPFVNPADNSDLMLLRGFIDIARKDMIPLDSLWSETFSFNRKHEDIWKAFSYPQIAAAQFPGMSAADLAYWSKPHLINPDSSDVNKCITYTRPFFYDGQIVAMLGVEVQVSQLERYYLPASDFEALGQSGYALIHYASEDAQSDSFSCDIYHVTGSYIKRLFGGSETLTLSATRRNNVFSADAPPAEEVQITFHPMRLYNSNAPFSGEKWAVASVGTDNALFEPSRKASMSVLYSSAIAVAIGSVFLIISIRRSTNPLISIANQIQKSEHDDPIIISNSNTYEITLLCTTINAMRQMRNLAEAKVHEERKRYLVALESAADTFMEYDVAQDSFMLYYFSDGEQESKLHSKTVPQFIAAVASGEFCHPDDSRKVENFFCAEDMNPIEIRAKTTVFNHISDVTPDGAYYWFLFKASCTYDDIGRISKIIGTAKEVTLEKLNEQIEIEKVRRDMTTKLYNRAYGTQMIRNKLAGLTEKDTPFALNVIFISNFSQLEAFYGRVFGGIVLMELSRRLLDAITEDDIIVRMSNDIIMLFCGKACGERSRALLKQLCEEAKSLYTGENAALSLELRIGTSFPNEASDCDELIKNAFKAARYAAKLNITSVCYADIPPDVRAEDLTLRENPVSISLDLSKKNVASFTFELFERTSDTHSAVKILLGVIGNLFSFVRIIICSYDSGFGADQVSYQWCVPGLLPHSENIEKISDKDMRDFEASLESNGTMLYNSDSIKSGEGAGRLLCLVPGERVCGYCCAIYENGVHTGRIMFVAEGESRIFTDDEAHDLYETSKIIAAHMSIEKSNSASRAKSEFLSRVSHEIRTPLNAIIGMAGIAVSAIDNPLRLSDSLKKIDFSAKHLLSLINEVLDMSRIESGKLIIENAPFSLHRFVSDIETLMRLPIESKNQSFIVNNTCRDVYVIGDEHHLRQVMVNLLGNANKFTEPGGVITFSIEELPAGEAEKSSTTADSTLGETGYFKFSVKDNGVGISFEDQPLLFKPFAQVGSGAARQKSQGTGLGLAISSNIISMMGGKIKLSSNLGEGSDFYFTLMLKLSNAGKDITENINTNFSGYFSGKRALLVEDIEINVEIASFILEETGLEIDVAVNGQEAVERFCASKPGYYDVILMDIQMPVMDGLTAARHIRSAAGRPDARTIPIIAMTANAFDEDMKKSVASGMNGHVAKPIESEKLFELLKQLL